MFQLNYQSLFINSQVDLALHVTCGRIYVTMSASMLHDMWLIPSRTEEQFGNLA
jgi:hypothetical protein